MKLILKREYFNPNWEEMNEQPRTCERPYVEYYVANDSGGVTLKEVGPFIGCEEAHEWFDKVGRKLEVTDHPHLKGER